MGRMVRLVNATPELLILVKGMVAAARSVFFTLVLLFVLLYMFGVAFTLLLEKEAVGNRLFNSVTKSMHTLWLYGALTDEITHLMRDVGSADAGLVCVILLDVFLLVSALTVMNMLVGVLCEVVSAVATSEKEELSLALVRSKVERIFHDMGWDKDAKKDAELRRSDSGSKDYDHDDQHGMVSREQFQKILENREAARAIQDLGVDVVQMVDMEDVFFASEDDFGTIRKELSFAEFMDAVDNGTNEQ